MFDQTGSGRRVLIALAVGVVAVALGAIARSAPVSAAPRDHVVTMANMSFGRMPTNVRVGDTIVWVNRDTVPHTATARNRSFDVRVTAGRRARMTVKHAGIIPIYCIYHPAMRASLKVVL